MDLDMADFMGEVARIITAAPSADAPADYLHQRGVICADALRAVADGEHPAEALAVVEQALEEAARPDVSDALMMWRPARVPA